MSKRNLASRSRRRPALEKLEDRTVPALVTFNLDAAQSSVTASGTLLVAKGIENLTANMNAQLEGSLTTAIAGTIKADLDLTAHTIKFNAATALDATAFAGGNLNPGVGGSGAAAAADLGASFDFLPGEVEGFSAFVALRGVTGSLSSDALTLGGAAADQTFAAISPKFSLAGGSADYTAYFDIIKGTKSLAGLQGSSLIGDASGHVQDLGNHSFKLTLPILAEFTATLASGVTAQLTLTGSLVGTASTNHAPTIGAFTSLRTPPGTALVLSTANHDAITLADADGDAQTVTLTATHGTLKLAATGGLTGVTGDGTATVSAHGSLADLNAALNGLTFTPEAGFKGTSHVKVSSDDGNATTKANIDVKVAPPLAVHVLNARVTEGDKGTVDVVFPLRLSEKLGVDTPVNFKTLAGTAKAGTDFVAIPSGTAIIPAGSTVGEIHVKVNGDLLDEANETFTVRLTNIGVGGVAGKGATATATIIDNDPAPKLSITDVSKKEGSHGTTNDVFTVTLSAPSGKTVTVNFATADGTAKAPGDYTASTGTLTFKPGQTTKTITVKVKGDTVKEANEKFQVKLSGAKNATLKKGIGTGTIVNDD